MSRKGFTLIELLIVVSIIGFIAAAAVFSIGYVRSRVRDTRRAADITELQKALAIYHNNLSIYPLSAGQCVTGGDAMSNALIAEKIVTKVPTDPLYDSPPNCYYYESSDGSTYSLKYTLEIDSGVGSAGEHTVNP